MAPKSTVEEFISCSSSLAKPPPPAYNEIITVTVQGYDVTKTFRVYKGVLCHYSDDFRALLNGSWKDSAGDIYLDNVLPDVFDLFFYWLNTGELSPIDKDKMDI
jgi:hypothetical protein